MGMSDKLLIDTSVWLDLAKDYRLSAVLTAIENLIDAETIELIMPQSRPGRIRAQQGSGG